MADVLSRVPHQVDPGTFPTISVEQDVGDFDISLLGPGAQQLVLTIAENLMLENEALAARDESILTAVDHGDRLVEMQDRLRQAAASGTTTLASYTFDTVTMSLVRAVRAAERPERRSRFARHGDRGDLRRGRRAAGRDTTSPFAKMFVIRRATGGRWLNVAVLPPKDRQLISEATSRSTWSAGTSCASVVVPSAQSIRTRSAVAASSRPKYASRGGPAR